MVRVITGSSFLSMVRYGVNNLEKQCAALNDLNVFPVPDGDTGTNMVMTLKNGLSSAKVDCEDLAEVSRSFANATVFGARGNSGVIASQFFKGVADGLSSVYEAGCADFISALESGVKSAYASVSNPVEGTILTVVREATELLRERAQDICTYNELLSTFIDRAKQSLENTPNLLPVLAKANVVDSGGAGIVCFFEGMERYLKSEPLFEITEEEVETEKSYDFSVFDKNTVFEYGYCTEFLLQLLTDESEFDYKAFVAMLEEKGESLVVSQEKDKVKVHVHTLHPDEILSLCHPYGEFLTLKIENMTVQNLTSEKKYYCSENEGSSRFSVIAVAPTAALQKMLAEMGADVVMLSKQVPTSNDFCLAFELVSTENILVFPNCANSILSAKQAAGLYNKAKVTVINSKSIAECYSALAIIDFDSDDVQSVASDIEETINGIYEISVSHAVKDTCYGGKDINKGEFFAISSDELLETARNVKELTLSVAKKALDDGDWGILNIFYGKSVSEESADELSCLIEELGSDAEIFTIPTEDNIYDIVLSFE